MTIAPVQTSLWEVLAGRLPGQPLAPAEPDVWQTVVDRLNPARMRPVRREGVEEAELVSARGQAYVMLRSPDREAAYVRLAPEEAELTRRMDGSRTVAGLVGEFARLTGRLAPDQVRRVVADLAANRMLEELPVDALQPLERVRRRSPAARVGRAVLAAAKGQRMVLGDVDRLAGALYRGGGRLLFTPVAAVVMATVSVTGLAVFVHAWMGGAQQSFVSGNSYALGGVLLLALNALCLGAHELGHALAAKHAGRRVPAAGFLFYYGIPSAFVDTTDVWMAGRRARLLTTAAGPIAALTLAGGCQLVGLLQPDLAPLAFKLSFCWYLNSLFNLNPMLALDGYYLLMDWLEIANLRLRGMGFLIGKVRGRAPRWQTLDREGRIVALYGVAAAVWLVVSVNLTLRTYRDRVSGLVAGLWYHGPLARIGLVAFVAGLAAPAVQPLIRMLARRVRARIEARRRRDRLADQPHRLDALRRTSLATLPAEALEQLAAGSTWRAAPAGDVVVVADKAPTAVLVVVEGVVEAHRPGDPVAAVRDRAGGGQVIGAAAVVCGGVSPLTWVSAGARLLVLDREAFLAAAPGLATDGAEAGEREAVLELPPFAGLSDDARMVLAGRLRPVDLAPGEDLPSSDADSSLVVSAGLLVTPSGAEVRRGDVVSVGSPGGEPPTRALTSARLWSVPTAGDGGQPPPGEPGRPDVGVHGEGLHPPLAAPPGPPPDDDDGTVDGGFLRRFRRLLELAAVAALLLIFVQCGQSTPWAEIPSDTALLVVRAGTVDATVAGRAQSFDEGSRVVIGRDDRVHTRDESVGAVVFRGGAEVVLCPRSDAVLRQVGSTGRDPVVPRAAIDMVGGAARAQTEPVTGAFGPLALDVRLMRSGATVTSRGEAGFSVAPAGLTVARGVVRVGDAVVAPTIEQLGCAGGAGSAGSGSGGAGSGDAGSSATGTGPGSSGPGSTGGEAPGAGLPGGVLPDGTDPVGPGLGPTPLTPSPPGGPVIEPKDPSPAGDPGVKGPASTTVSGPDTTTVVPVDPGGTGPGGTGGVVDPGTGTPVVDPGTGTPVVDPGGTGGPAGPGGTGEVVDPGGGGAVGEGRAEAVPGAAATPGAP